MKCTEHQWVFDKSDDAGHMYWHCKTCGEASVTTPKKIDGEAVPDYLVAQGVQKEDFVWWRDLSFNERESLIRAYYAANTTAFNDSLSKGASAEDSMRQVNKLFVQYADYPLGGSHIQELKSLGYTEEDYPLPWQLRNKCDKFIWSCFNEGEATQRAFRENAETYQTINALFRTLIRAGL